MAKVVRKVTLKEPSASVLRRVGSALELGGWDVTYSERGLEADEDATRLCCVQSPARVQICSPEAEEAAAVLEITVKVPGFGPVASRDLRARLGFLLRAITAG